MEKSQSVRKAALKKKGVNRTPRLTREEVEKSQSGRKAVLKKKGAKQTPRLTIEEIAEALRSRKRIHVIDYGDRWGVLRAGAKRLSKIHTDRLKAIAHAKELAKKSAGTKIVVHGENGSPQEYIQPEGE